MNVVVDVDVVVNVHVNGGFHSAKTWSKKQDSANLLPSAAGPQPNIGSEDGKQETVTPLGRV